MKFDVFDALKIARNIVGKECEIFTRYTLLGIAVRITCLQGTTYEYEFTCSYRDLENNKANILNFKFEEACKQIARCIV